MSSLLDALALRGEQSSKLDTYQSQSNDQKRSSKLDLVTNGPASPERCPAPSASAATRSRVAPGSALPTHAHGECDPGGNDGSPRGPRTTPPAWALHRSTPVRTARPRARYAGPAHLRR